MTMDASARVLERYNAKVFKNRKEHMLRINRKRRSRSRPIPAPSRHNDQPRLLLRRLQGRGARPHQGYGAHYPRPRGLRLYSWGTRRNKARAEEGEPNFIQYCFTTDLQEPDIVFGGTKSSRPPLTKSCRLMNPSSS